MAKKKAKRKSSRKRAHTKRDVLAQLSRFTPLLDQWVAKTVLAAKNAAAYRKKVSYYQKRLAVIHRQEAAEHAALVAASEARRPRRAIRLSVNPDAHGN